MPEHSIQATAVKLIIPGHNNHELSVSIHSSQKPHTGHSSEIGHQKPLVIPGHNNNHELSVSTHSSQKPHTITFLFALVVE
jgi:hypothetical protein